MLLQLELFCIYAHLLHLAFYRRSHNKKVYLTNFDSVISPVTTNYGRYVTYKQYRTN